MMTSSNGDIFRVTGHLCGEFPAQRPVTWSFDAFFGLRLNKRLSKQSWGWWFDTASYSLWLHCNELIPGANEFIILLFRISLVGLHRLKCSMATLRWSIAHSFIGSGIPVSDSIVGVSTVTYYQFAIRYQPLYIRVLVVVERRWGNMRSTNRTALP